LPACLAHSQALAAQEALTLVVVQVSPSHSHSYSALLSFHLEELHASLRRGDGHDTGRSLRRGKAVRVPDDRWYRRSGVVLGRGRPAATSAAAPPSPPPRSPSPRSMSGLRGFRFPGRFRSGGRFEALFFGLPGGGRWGTLQLAVRPVLTTFPIAFQLGAKGVSCFNLLTGDGSLLRRQEARTGLASHRAGEAVVRAMARLAVLGAGTSRLAALDSALRQRATTHRFRFSQLGSELAELGGRHYIVHGSILRLY